MCNCHALVILHALLAWLAAVTGTAIGAFFCRRDAQGCIDRWWLEVTGKGKETRLAPATDELIAELARYRRAYGLAPTAQPGEDRPLLLPVIGSENRDKGLSRGALHLILKEVFGLAAARLRARARMGGAGPVLARASAHWLRHTARSHMTDQQVDLRFVRDNFGHSYTEAKGATGSQAKVPPPPAKGTVQEEFPYGSITWMKRSEGVTGCHTHRPRCASFLRR